MEAWALGGWRGTDPVPFYKAPNSSFGSYLGLILGYTIPSPHIHRDAFAIDCKAVGHLRLDPLAYPPLGPIMQSCAGPTEASALQCTDQASIVPEVHA